MRNKRSTNKTETTKKNRQKHNPGVQFNSSYTPRHYMRSVNVVASSTYSHFMLLLTFCSYDVNFATLLCAFVQLAGQHIGFMSTRDTDLHGHGSLFHSNILICIYLLSANIVVAVFPTTPTSLLTKIA